MNILTFDVEDWYCNCVFKDLNWDKYEFRLLETYNNILQELSVRNIKATFFCLGWVAEKHPEIIKMIDREGHHIGCHSYQHILISEMQEKEFKSDSEKAKKLIEDVIGKEINAYRAPAWSITSNNKWALKVLAEIGFKYDCSIFPTTHDFGGMPEYGNIGPAILDLGNGFSIKEFPVNTKKIFSHNIVFSGGGFFRFFPYYLIKKWVNNSDYIMSYFHSSDFDVDQPIVKDLPLSRRFKTYYGLNNAFQKFVQYIEDNEFNNIIEADDKIKWNKIQL